MADETHEPGYSSETIDDFTRQTSLAYRIAKEAILRSNTAERSQTEDRLTDLRWRVTYGDIGTNIILSIELFPLTTRGIMHCSLGQTVLAMLGDLEGLLSDPEALKSLEVEEQERDDVIFERLVGLTLSYILYLPLVLYHSFYQAINESTINHIKKVVEPLYREDGDDSSGKPKYLNLIPHKHLNDIVKLFPNVDFHFLKHLDAVDREFKDYRKGIYSNRQVFLTPERFENLYVEYDQLRGEFRGIKRDYKKRREAFFLTNPNAVLDDWMSHWNKCLDEKFPFLSFTQNDVERTPAELAFRHLASSLDFHPETMERKVRESRSLATERRRNSENSRFSMQRSNENPDDPI